MKGRVLIVDDDTALAEMLGIVLRNEGYEPSVVIRGDEVLPVFREFKPDLVLLDLMLPGKDGIDVCKEIRAESGVPIVMLTAKSDTVDIVVGLESGADDYVVKPFKPKELVARVRARLRRTDDPKPETLAVGDLAIDVAKPLGQARWHRHCPDPLEFDLLACLARRPWQVFTRKSCWRRCGGTVTRPTPAGQRPRPASALEGRARPGASRGRRDRSRCRLQGRSGLT